MRIARPLGLLFGASAFLLTGCSTPQDDIRAALAGVCAGQGVPQAAAYTGGGVHPMVALSSDGEPHDWTNDVPEVWTPASLDAAQLVACVRPEQERSIEVCHYNGPDITRYRYEVTIRLVEARTGAEVASTVLVGSDPRECRSTEDYDLTRLAGDHISFSEAEDWLRDHVEMASVSVSAAPGQVEPAPVAQSPSGGSDAPFVGAWQATDAHDGSSMRLTVSRRAGEGYPLVWDDDYASVCGEAITLEGSGRVDANDPNILHTDWMVECGARQVGEFAADFRYTEADDTLEVTYDDGIRETWYRTSGP